jgi:hypothetical protein
VDDRLWHATTGVSVFQSQALQELITGVVFAGAHRAAWRAASTVDTLPLQPS